MIIEEKDKKQMYEKILKCVEELKKMPGCKNAYRPIPRMDLSRFYYFDMFTTYVGAALKEINERDDAFYYYFEEAKYNTIIEAAVKCLNMIGKDYEDYIDMYNEICCEDYDSEEADEAQEYLRDSEVCYEAFEYIIHEFNLHILLNLVKNDILNN